MNGGVCRVMGVSMKVLAVLEWAVGGWRIRGEEARQISAGETEWRHWWLRVFMVALKVKRNQPHSLAPGPLRHRVRLRLPVRQQRQCDVCGHRQGSWRKEL